MYFKYDIVQFTMIQTSTIFCKMTNCHSLLRLIETAD